MKYDLGAGRSKPGAGWLTVDADPRSGADIIATLPPIPETLAGAEVFRLIHVLEHFHLWEARTILADCFRLLAPGGLLVIECPNLESAIETLSGRNGKRADQWGMWVLYGDPRSKNPLYNHKWGWTPATLRTELEAVGFGSKLIREERAKYHVPGRDFRMVAQK